MIRAVACYVDCPCVDGSYTLKHAIHGECFKCGGSRLVERRLSLEDFGKLFTQTEVHTYTNGDLSVERYLMPRTPLQVSTGHKGEGPGR